MKGQTRTETKTQTKGGNNQPTVPDHQQWHFEGPKTVLFDTGQKRVYAVLEPGNVIRGYLMGTDWYMNEKRNERVNHFVIFTDQACEVEEGGEGSEPEIAPAGIIVHLNEKQNLKKLYEFLELTYMVRVCVQCISKDPIGGGHTVWRFKIAAEPTERKNMLADRQMPQLTATAEASQSVPGQPEPPPLDDSDIPF